MKKFKLALAGVAIVVGAVGASVTGVFAASQSANVTINATIQEVISAASFGTTPNEFNVTPGATVQTSSAQQIRISTNAAGGYILYVKDADNDTSLRLNASNNIAASTNAFTSPNTLANNTWGYRLSTFTANHYAGITDTNVQINSATGPISNHPTDITYDVLVDSSKISGTYTDVITYTAVTPAG